MVKLTNLKVSIPKNHVLVEVIDDTGFLTISNTDIQLGNTKDGLKYSEGEFSTRRGYLITMPNKIDYSESGTPWKNEDRPNVGDIVYFDYLTGKNCTHCEYEGKIYYILPFRSLVLSLNANMDTNTIQMLNGFILADTVLRPRISELEYKDTYYPDRFLIKRIGSPNKEYLDGLIDDEGVKVGDVVLTRFRNYQQLEADYQLRLDGNKYVFFQRKEIIGIL